MKNILFVLMLSGVALMAQSRPLSDVNIRYGGFTRYDSNGVPFVSGTFTGTATTSTNINISTVGDTAVTSEAGIPVAIVSGGTGGGEVTSETVTNLLLELIAISVHQSNQVVTLTASNAVISARVDALSTKTDALILTNSQAINALSNQIAGTLYTLGTNAITLFNCSTNYQVAVDSTDTGLAAGDVEFTEVAIDNASRFSGGSGEVIYLTWITATNTTEAKNKTIIFSSAQLTSWPETNAASIIPANATNIFTSVNFDTNTAWAGIGNGMIATLPMYGTFKSDTIYMYGISPVAKTNAIALETAIIGWRKN